MKDLVGIRWHRWYRVPMTRVEACEFCGVARTTKNSRGECLKVPDAVMRERANVNTEWRNIQKS